jgi:hypothetical protein
MKNRSAILFRDLADGLRQQMYFWGLDAIHPDGNLFVRSGFHKRPSTGLQGTSCYSFPWQGGVIELHGSHAGWLGAEDGFLYIRPHGRCVRWLDSAPPIPGVWPGESYENRSEPSLHAVAVPFLHWWLHHESQVTQNAGTAYRDDCFRKFKKLPKTRAWLPPATATRWISQLAENPASLARAKHFSPS